MAVAEFGALTNAMLGSYKVEILEMALAFLPPQRYNICSTCSWDRNKCNLFIQALTYSIALELKRTRFGCAYPKAPFLTDFA